jgi:hypothetical protein
VLVGEIKPSFIERHDIFPILLLERIQQVQKASWSRDSRLFLSRRWSVNDPFSMLDFLPHLVNQMISNCCSSNQDPLDQLPKWRKRRLIKALQNRKVNSARTPHLSLLFCYFRRIGKTLLSQVPSSGWVSHGTFSKSFVGFSVDYDRSKMLHGEIKRDWFKVHSGPSRTVADRGWSAFTNGVYFDIHSIGRLEVIFVGLKWSVFLHTSI